MKIIKVISLSKDGNRKEVIVDAMGVRNTYHIHRQPKGWSYCIGYTIDRSGKREPGFELMNED